MFARWKEGIRNWTGRLRLLSGEGEDIAKVAEKVVEKIVADGAIANISAGTVTGGFFKGPLGAGAGLVVTLVVHTAKNSVVARRKSAQDPLRYLTLMEKAGGQLRDVAIARGQRPSGEHVSDHPPRDPIYLAFPL